MWELGIKILACINKILSLYDYYSILLYYICLQVRQYFEDGYVLIEDFLDPADIQAAKDDVTQLVEELAQKLYKAGKIKDLYTEYDLYKRLTMMEKEFKGSNVLLHRLGRLTPAMKKLWSNERLLNIMEQLLQTKDIIG